MKVVTLLAAGAFTGLGMAQDLQGVSECAVCLPRVPFLLFWDWF